MNSDSDWSEWLPEGGIYMAHIFPQGENISQLYPTYYSTRVYTGGIYFIDVRSFSSCAPDFSRVSDRILDSQTLYS